MTEDSQLAAALTSLSESLLGAEDAAKAAAECADAELAAQWNGLRRATTDYEKRLLAWSDGRRQASRDRERLASDARILSEAWSAAREHLGSGGAVAGRLRERAASLDALSDDDRAALAAALKNALRSFASFEAPAVTARAKTEEASAAKTRLEDELRKRSAAEDEARRLKIELEAARLRLARLEGAREGSDSAYVFGQAREVMSLRKDRDALTQQLKEAHDRIVKAEVSPSEAAREVARMARDLDKARREAQQERADAERERADAAKARAESERLAGEAHELRRALADAQEALRAAKAAAAAPLHAPPPPPPGPDPELEKELLRAKAKLAKLTSLLK